MPGQRTDASVAFSATENLSQSIAGMKNSVNSFKGDVTGLQRQLDTLTNTRFQLKNFDLKQAQQELQRTKRAFEELGEAATDAEREAARADFQRANQNYENVRSQLNLVSRQARQTERDLLDATGAISRAENRAGRSGGVLSSLGQAGAFSAVGDIAGQWARVLISSSAGSTEGSLFSGALGGMGSGAAIGTMVGGPGVGTAAGAAVGGVLGLVQGGSQVYEAQNEAFRSYYQQLYEQGQTEAETSLSSGSATAAQRELDAMAFNRLLGTGIGDSYLSDLRTLAADTPLEYSDLTTMSRSLATGFGDSPERMLDLMTAIGDAGSAVGVTAADMNEMARAMSRMNSSGKATLEYLNILQERGVNVIGMLADEYGKTQGEIYDMISRGQIDGRDAVDIIQRGMESMYGGAMETMAGTFSGLTSTLQDAMTELDNARGEGYNAERSEGLQAEIDAYGGELGEAIQSLNRISGENQAYMENLSDQYMREALSAVLLGQDTTLFGSEQQADLAAMRESYLAASEEYADGSQEAGIKMDNLRRQAESLATAAYENSEQYQLMQDAELDLIGAIRENTSALNGWRSNYAMSEELSKGLPLFANYDSSLYTGDDFRDSAAFGIRRVPYDNYAALLHDGERVLTAREAREYDRGSGGVSVNISGTWAVSSPADVDSIAETIVKRLELAMKAGVRS